MAGKVLAWVGLALCAAGALIGFVPLSSGQAGCGSAWRPSSGFGVMLTAGTQAADACSTATSLARFGALAVLAVGACLAVAGAAVRSRELART